MWGMAIGSFISQTPAAFKALHVLTISMRGYGHHDARNRTFYSVSPDGGGVQYSAIEYSFPQTISWQRLIIRGT